jgi:hypothetical protein
MIKFSHKRRIFAVQHYVDFIDFWPFHKVSQKRTTSAKKPPHIINPLVCHSEQSEESLSFEH